jgi:hypothetical protein
MTAQCTEVGSTCSTIGPYSAPLPELRIKIGQTKTLSYRLTHNHLIILFEAINANCYRPNDSDANRVTTKHLTVGLNAGQFTYRPPHHTVITPHHNTQTKHHTTQAKHHNTSHHTTVHPTTQTPQHTTPHRHHNTSHHTDTTLHQTTQHTTSHHTT